MHSISRRAALRGIALLPSVASIHAVAEETHDPLLDAIRAYRAGLDDYNKNAPDDDDRADAYADISYAPPFHVLQEWEAPATTYKGALEALRVIAKENEDFEVSPITGPLLAAALAYFEAQS